MESPILVLITIAACVLFIIIPWSLTASKKMAKDQEKSQKIMANIKFNEMIGMCDEYKDVFASIFYLPDYDKFLEQKNQNFPMIQEYENAILNASMEADDIKHLLRMSKKYNPDIYNALLANHTPKAISARSAYIRENKKTLDEIIKKKDQAMDLMTEQLKYIGVFDPSIKTFEDLRNIPDYEDFLNNLKKSNSIYVAFTETRGEKFRTMLNSVGSKAKSLDVTSAYKAAMCGDWEKAEKILGLNLKPATSKKAPSPNKKVSYQPQVIHFSARPPADAEIVCSVCGYSQASDRNICWVCKSKFIFDNEG